MRRTTDDYYRAPAGGQDHFRGTPAEAEDEYRDFLANARQQLARAQAEGDEVLAATYARYLDHARRHSPELL